MGYVRVIGLFVCEDYCTPACTMQERVVNFPQFFERVYGGFFAAGVSGTKDPVQPITFHSKTDHKEVIWILCVLFALCG